MVGKLGASNPGGFHAEKEIYRCPNIAGFEGAGRRSQSLSGENIIITGRIQDTADLNGD
jgi:hypothetical protein